jgi:hypothetical protein
VPGLADAFVASPLSLAELALVGFIALAPALIAEVVRSARRTTWLA